MKKNKKGTAGNTLQQLIFYAGELGAGVLILVMAFNLVNATSQNAEAELIASDIKYTLETLAVYPYTSYLSYAADMSGTIINIQEEEIKVSARKGDATIPLKIARGRKIDDANFYNPQEIPMILMEGTISFEDEQIKKMGCEQKFKFNPPKTFAIIYEYETQEQKNKLEKIRQGINQLYKPDGENKLIDTIDITNRETHESLNIIIKVNPDTSDTIIKTNPEIKGHETFSCYAQQLTKQGFQTFTKLQEIKEQRQDIIIYIPGIRYLEEYLQEDKYEQERKQLRITTKTALMQQYSKIIFNEIILNMVNYE